MYLIHLILELHLTELESHHTFCSANLDLLPERQESYELGLEMSFLKRRLGFDVSYTTIKTSTKFQLFHYLLQLDTALLY
jgi:hypothetical protein